MAPRLQSLVPQSLHTYLASPYRAIRRRMVRLDRLVDRRTMDPREFEVFIRQLGIETGAVVLVHSSWDAIVRRVPTLSPTELIRTLQNTLTESGTLLMPTFPFTGKQVRYIEATDRFDVRRSPSQVGLVTEVFRRMPGVVRSLHPTHPVAGWGKHTQELLACHHLEGTFGANSPFHRLCERDGMVVGLGTGLRDSFTILHVPEEIHPRAREHFFESQTRTMTIVNGGTEIPYTFRALRGEVRRNYGRVERILVREGILRYVAANGLRGVVTHADVFIRRCMTLVDEDNYL